MLPKRVSVTRAILANTALNTKALHSELLTKLLSPFLSRNEFFAISEVRVLRHFFVIFGNFGIEQFPKFPNVWKTLFPNFSELFPYFLTQKQGFLTQKLKL
jgi:hypothetical protein